MHPQNRYKNRKIRTQPPSDMPEDIRTPLQKLTYRVLLRLFKEHGLYRAAHIPDISTITFAFADIAERLPYGLEESAKPVCRNPGDLRLTAHERRALIGVARGMPHEEIARCTGYSKDTVKYHLRCAYHTLGAHNAPHAVMLAFRAGILTASDFDAWNEE